MHPEDYYLNHFKNHWKEFLTNSKGWIHLHGKEDFVVSCSAFWNQEFFLLLPDKQRQFFFYSIACDVLHDELMFTHFENDYQQFKLVTNYPKIEIGITNYLIKPWWIAERSESVKYFPAFCKFYIGHIKDFHQNNEFTQATWGTVYSIMLKDLDVAEGTYGKLFLKELNDCLELTK